MGVARNFCRGDINHLGAWGRCKPPSGVQGQSPWKRKTIRLTIWTDSADIEVIEIQITSDNTPLSLSLSSIIL